MNKQTFLQQFAPAIVEATKGTGLFPSVMLAQLALETAWGDSIKTAGNNCFGIKSTPKWAGKTISNTTSEVINRKRQVFAGTGKVYDTYQSAIANGCHPFTLFRAYESIAESIKDHNDLLLNAVRYMQARNADTPEKQAELIEKAGYATGKDYSKTLISIIHSNNLKSFDQ